MFPPTSPPESTLIVNNASTAMSLSSSSSLQPIPTNPGLGEAALEATIQVLQVLKEASLIKKYQELRTGSEQVKV